MFASTAQAAAPAGAPAAGGGGPLDSVGPFLLPVALFALFYFMVLRPQQARQKAQAATLGGLKRGDPVMLTGGILGKVVKVEDVEVQVEIAPNTVVRVVRAQIAEVRTPTPANDAAKPAKLVKP